VNVVFVNYYDFTSNSAIHIFNLANKLVEMGVGCSVAVPHDPATVDVIGAPRFQALDFRDARKGGLRFPDDGPPTLVHAWTPRELVRELTEELSSRYGCPYVVHLEDNEDVITANSLGLTLDQLHAASPGELGASFPSTLAHPLRMRAFLAGAAGVTVIIDRLLEFQPHGVPAEVIWPAFEPGLFTADPPEPELRRRLGIADGDSVLVYAGNAHPSNAAEMRSLYLAVAAVNRARRPLKLVRLGRDYVRFVERELRSIEQHVIRVPLQPRSEVPRYMRLADVLVQSGRPDGFNDYRLPAKLPEFLATGRPVVLPATNIGRFLEDGEQCVLLRRGDALEIAGVVGRLLDDPELRARLAKGARAFAERNFSWVASARKLKRFYDRVLGLVPTSLDLTDSALHHARDRYSGCVPPRLSYATARDYCDSADQLPLLATANEDMKDVQRPWMLKAILGTVPPGSRLLEIGAGEPIVADLLARLGYDVTVIDPYDGRDGGPAEFEAMRAAYPRVRIVRGLFPHDATEQERFDCIYSISVLEHLPIGAIDEVCAQIRRLARDGGHTIHAIDHVLRGAGDADHLLRLRRMVGSLGVAESELEQLLAELADDAETYFLSAESHNRWRAGVPYDEFPMRRCVSIQLCVPIDGAS
jgi:glycosyltransferase involved in cell wall biosynthesis/2-polyprenyl-3-methyl-5-hydroxy-6-metoxy-1,4-benzoquinol methylase